VKIYSLESLKKAIPLTDAKSVSISAFFNNSIKVSSPSPTTTKLNPSLSTPRGSPAGWGPPAI